jgi:hypothetical protein
MNEKIHFDPSAQPYNTPKANPVGFALGAGIFFLPYFFAWLLIRKNKKYSTAAKIVSFSWMVVLIGLYALPKPATPPTQLSGVTAIQPTSVASVAPVAPTQLSGVTTIQPVVQKTTPAPAETVKPSPQEIAFQEIFNSASPSDHKKLCAEVKSALTGLFKKGNFLQISINAVEVRYADEYAQISERKKNEICLALSVNALCNKSQRGSHVSILGVGKGFVPDACRQGQYSGF